MDFDARSLHVGAYSAWLTKQKRDKAKAKWFTARTKRYFTIDFDQQRFSYAQTEDGKYCHSTHFVDIVSAETMPSSSAHTKVRENRYGFVVNTIMRSYELYAPTEQDARQWVAGLNAAHDMAFGRSANGLDANDNDGVRLGRNLSVASLSTATDGESDACTNSDSSDPVSEPMNSESLSPRGPTSLNRKGPTSPPAPPKVLLGREENIITVAEKPMSPRLPLHNRAVQKCQRPADLQQQHHVQSLLPVLGEVCIAQTHLVQENQRYDRAVRGEMYLDGNVLLFRRAADGSRILAGTEDDVVQMRLGPFCVIRSLPLKKVVSPGATGIVPKTNVLAVTPVMPGRTYLFSFDGDNDAHSNAMCSQWEAAVVRAVRQTTEGMFTHGSKFEVQPASESSDKLMAGYLLQSSTASARTESTATLVFVELHAPKEGSAWLVLYNSADRTGDPCYKGEIDKSVVCSERLGNDCRCFSIGPLHFTARTVFERRLWLRAILNVKVKLQAGCPDTRPEELAMWRESIRDYVIQEAPHMLAASTGSSTGKVALHDPLTVGDGVHAWYASVHEGAREQLTNALKFLALPDSTESLGSAMKSLTLPDGGSRWEAELRTAFDRLHEFVTEIDVGGEVPSVIPADLVAVKRTDVAQSSRLNDDFACKREL